MIPKIIHYCWFGRNPKSPLAEKCIKSWKKYCPDYKIIEWNEDNFDININCYAKQAYECKKWAFVTDYVRLYVLYNYGGIYMDTDVEVIKPIDRFLKHDAFSGFESERVVPTGIMASKKGQDEVGHLLSYYENRDFILNGKPDITTNVRIITDMLMERGLVLNNCYQEVNGIALYPNDFFCPKDLSSGRIVKTKRTYTIHHFAGSWFSEEKRKKRRAGWRKVRRQRVLDWFIHIPNRVLMKVLGHDRYEKLKKKIKSLG